MDRDEILDHLGEVGRRLLARGAQGDLYVVGGAAMALAYDARRTTRDIDAVFEPKALVYEIAAMLVRERGLPADWLNDSVKGLLQGPDPYDTEVFDLPGLRIEAASPHLLLALKVLAHRRIEDGDDVAVLVRMLGLADTDAVLDLAERLLAPVRLTVAAKLFVEEVMAHREH